MTGVLEYGIGGHAVTKIKDTGDCSLCPLGSDRPKSYYNCECGLTHVCLYCMHDHLITLKPKGRRARFTRNMVEVRKRRFLTQDISTTPPHLVQTNVPFLRSNL